MARKRLVPKAEVMEFLSELRGFGLDIQSVDIREDGITLSSLPSPPSLLASPALKEEATSAYDRWKAQGN